MTPSGGITRFFVQDNGIPGTVGITVGPDGNLWFTEWTHEMVGRVTPSGAMTTFTDELGTRVQVEDPTAITAGPDGAMWFTSSANDRIGRLGLGAPLAGKVTGPAGPIGDAWVLAIAADGSTVRGARTSRADSSEDGNYALFLDPGHYAVEILDPTGAHAGEWHDNQPLSGLGDASIIEVGTAGATVNASLDADGRTARVAGTVTATGTSAPLGGVWVWPRST